MSPLSLMAIITFLELHKQADCATVYAQCKPFTTQINGELNKLYLTTFANTLNDNVEWVGGREIGGAFHLAMLAVKQLSYELYQVESEKPIAMEVSRKVDLVSLNKKGQAVTSGQSYTRRVDIVLKGDANSDMDYEDEQNIWVEVKSLKYNSKYLDSWKPWSLKGSKYSYHRQFYLDRVASTNNSLPLAKGLKVRRSQDFEWWLQDFKRSSRRAYNDGEMSKVITRIRHLPSTKIGNAYYASLGYNEVNDNNVQFPKAKASSRFKQQNSVDQKSIDELIND